MFLIHMILLLRVMEIIYLLYMFLLFKTSLDFNLYTQGMLAKSKLFKHLEQNQYGNRICLFGHIMIILLCIFIILREIYPLPQYLTWIVLIISLLLSLLNLNAVVYFIPFWTIELIIELNTYYVYK